MRLLTFLLLVFSLFGLTSCIEIIDDVTVNNDGSGSLKYTINLSASKVKINSILALDSLEGRPVPSKEELEERIVSFKKKLASKTGISNVIVESNFEDYIFKLSCDFASVQALQHAVKEVVMEETKEKNLEGMDHDWLLWDGNKLSRSIPEITLDRTRNLKPEDAELLKQGNYTSITRFQRPVEKFENTSAVLSKNRLAVMVKTNPYLLTQDNDLLENTIYLTPLK
jgi:hypothetical protein